MRADLRREDAHPGPPDVTPWLALFAGPAGWFLHLATSYALVPFACASGARTMLHAVTVVALLLPACGIVLALRNRRRTRRMATANAEAGRRDNRADFMSLIGFALSAYFLLVLLFAGVPNLMIDPCR